MDIEELAKKNFINGDTLDLENRQIGDAGVKALTGLDFLDQVRRLELGDNKIGDEGVAALAQCAGLSNLKILNLKSNNISAQGALSIAQSPNLFGLEQLIMKFNQIGEEGANFASDILFKGKKQGFGQLLGDGASAFYNPSRLDIFNHGADGL